MLFENAKYGNVFPSVVPSPPKSPTEKFRWQSFLHFYQAAETYKTTELAMHLRNLVIVDSASPDHQNCKNATWLLGRIVIHK